MLAVTLILGVASLIAINRLSASLDKAVNLTTKKITLVGDIWTARSDMLAAQRGVIMFTYAKRQANIDKAKKLFESAADRWAASLTELRPLLVTVEGRQSADGLAASLSAWKPVFAEIVQSSAAGNMDGAVDDAVSRGVPIYDATGRDHNNCGRSRSRFWKTIGSSPPTEPP